MKLWNENRFLCYILGKPVRTVQPGGLNLQTTRHTKQEPKENVAGTSKLTLKSLGNTGLVS